MAWFRTAEESGMPTVGFVTRFDFAQERAQFYLDLCQSMRAMPGVPIANFLANTAQRYPRRAVGRIAACWLARLPETGTLTEAMRGTVPREDITVLAVAERAGDLAIGLESLGTNIEAMAKTRRNLLGTLASGMVLVMLLHVFLAVQAFMVMPQLQRALEAGGATHLSLLAKALFGGAALIRTWWPLEAVLLAVCIGWGLWSMSHYVGRARPWLDRYLLPYQMYRDFQGASFFITLGAVTRLIGAQIVQVADALHRIRANAMPWLRWHIDRILQNMEEQPNARGELFDTGIVSESNYYRVVDVAEYAQLSNMLTTVGELIVKTTPIEVAKKATRTRFVLMLICITLMGGIYVGSILVINEFKNEMQAQAMTR